MRNPSSLADRWILSRLQQTIRQVTKALDGFLFNDATNAIYEFLWHDFCDWYLELSKIAGQTAHSTQQTAAILTHVLETSLRLLHPIMPFVTEELWQHLMRPETRDLRPETAPPRQSHVSGLMSHVSIMTAPWPKPSAKLVDVAAEREFARLMALILAIRATRAELHVPVDSTPPLVASAKQPAARRFIETHAGVIRSMARVRDVNVHPSLARRPKHAAAMVVDGIELFLPLEGLIDLAVERKRLEQRQQELQEELSRLEARLRDPQFLEKAPKDVVEQARTRRTETQDTLRKCSAHLQTL